jgi:glycine/sarcosine/betaine reductase complex component A
MDLHTQEAIIKLVDQHGKDGLLVVLGAPDPESAEIAAETVVLGDPSYAGPLAGTQLGLDVYHILEDEIRTDVPEDVWEDEIGVMSDVLDGQGISAAVSAMRAKAADASA